ncbi:hypothetical protein HGM15179_017658 [Zosterops borbonicus]|uniref:Uncharacterized protein n=1 Tax=Zosterops borbonicus TaxID=364589 RepID=A0A8K1G0I3_9PASS|nr:hypothetical protein HGM15179_017658 [Zosterops borbonicus]
MAAGAAQELGEGRGGRGFLGPRVLAEVETMSRGVQDVDKETFQRLLKVLLSSSTLGDMGIYMADFYR